MPDGLKRGEKAPGIVMFHGFTGNKTEAHRLFVDVARALSHSGYVVLRFDFRGSGDSEGDFGDMTIPGEVSDAEKALAFLSKQRMVDPQKVGVIGLSMGGRVGAILASKDKRVKLVVLYSAALSPLRKRFLEGADKEALRELDSGESIKVGEGWYLKKSFFDSVDQPVPLDVMSEIRVPVLLIHGDADQVVPLEDSRKGYETIKKLNSRNELHVVKSADHVFSERDHTSEVIKKTLEWLGSLTL